MQPQTPDRESPLSASPGAESQIGTQTRTATFRPESSEGDRAELPPPATLGRYEIRELLGRGAFGAVYLGWDPQLKRQVAIKVPRLAADNSMTENVPSESAEAQIEAFLEEARRAVQLERHQGIVPVYDVGRDGELCYIVSQYIDGGTLSQLMKRGLLPVDKAVALVATLADIAHFAHKQGWVHRDIKPSNILLDSERKPYLADFGLTSRLDDIRSGGGSPHGTPNYMAPELAREALCQLRHEKSSSAQRPDQRSDVYSLGVVLYQLLTGRLPFVADNLEDLFDLVLHSEPLPLRQAGAKISARLEDVCLKALAKEPHDRYQTAADLRDDLRIVSATMRDTEGQVKVYDRSPWGFSRTRLAAIVGTWLLLCILLGAVYYAASFAFRKPEEHSSPGGETNVAMATRGTAEKETAAKGTAARELPAKPDTIERQEDLHELRALLRAEAKKEEIRQESYFRDQHLFNGVRRGDKDPAPPQGLSSPKAEAAKAARALQERFKSLEQQKDSTRKGQGEERETLKEALALAQEVKDETAEAELLIRLGNAESRAGKDARAIEYYSKADQLFSPDAADESRSRLYYNWISALLAEQRYDEARVLAGRLKEIARPDDPLVQKILKSLE